MITINMTVNLSAPKGTKVITCDKKFVTLARKNKENFEVLVCPTEEITSKDLNDDFNWMELTKKELQEILKMK